jgi:hypothetical protein
MKNWNLLKHGANVPSMFFSLSPESPADDHSGSLNTTAPAGAMRSALDVTGVYQD